MCNLYSVTKSQTAIIEASRAMRDTTGNLPPLPGIFPDYPAPIVRNAPGGVRELCIARWGMPCPPQFGAIPVTNIPNTKSAHWRRWLGLANRCLIPWTSFCEYADTKPKKTPTWFAFADLYFNDADRMKRVMDTPEAKATVADLPNFATGGVTVLISEMA